MEVVSGKQGKVVGKKKERTEEMRKKVKEIKKKYIAEVAKYRKK